MKSVVTVMMRLVGKRTCKDVVSVLHDYLEGTLDPKLAAIIERHFDGCPNCVSFVRTYREVIRLTGEIPCDEIPAEVQDRVRRALRDRSR